GLLRDEMQSTARGVFAPQRPLRALEHLDSLEVEQGERLRQRVRDEDLVLIEADWALQVQRGIIGADTAQEPTSARLATTALLTRKVRRQTLYVVGRRYVLLDQLLPAGYRN